MKEENAHKIIRGYRMENIIGSEMNEQEKEYKNDNMNMLRIMRKQ